MKIIWIIALKDKYCKSMYSFIVLVQCSCDITLTITLKRLVVQALVLIVIEISKQDFRPIHTYTQH